MKILVWPSDEAGCGHYRQIFAARALIAQGHDVEITTVGPTLLWDREWSGNAPPLDAQVLGVLPVDADVVVIGRPGRKQWFDAITHIQAQGVRVIVDVDDDFSCIPRQNIAAPAYDPRLSPFHSSHWVAAACEIADLVTVTTPALAKRYGAHGRVAVLPNLIPESYLSVTADHEPDPMVGWSGTVETHPHDLEVTGGAIHRALMAVPGSKLGVVGTGGGVAERLRCDISRVTGWVPFADYPLAMASLDVGVVPLHDSAFNHAKSSLKASEFAALGVPVVMSPTPDNRRLNTLGVGLLADSPSQWRKHVTRLLLSQTMREDMAGRGREVMATQTYERLAERWLTAWTATDRELVSV